jgi:hypothetical protein
MAIGKLFGREKSETTGEDAQLQTASNGELEKAGIPSYDDEAQEPQSIDPIMEKRVVRKLDRNIIPLVMALCRISLSKHSLCLLLMLSPRSPRIFGSKQYRVSVPHAGNLRNNRLILTLLCRNARIAGMSEDLHLSSANYDWLLTIFYISYIVVSFKEPSTPFSDFDMVLVRVPSLDVESRSTALLGSVLRLRMVNIHEYLRSEKLYIDLHQGTCSKRARRNPLMVRPDGTSLLYGRLGSRIWTWNPVPTLLFLHAPRTRRSLWLLLSSCAIGEHFCWCAGIRDHIWTCQNC